MRIIWRGRNWAGLVIAIIAVTSGTLLWAIGTAAEGTEFDLLNDKGRCEDHNPYSYAPCIHTGGIFARALAGLLLVLALAVVVVIPIATLTVLGYLVWPHKVE